MKMHDMKMKKRTKEEMMPKGISEDEGDRYPYGLKLRLDTEQIDKMPMMKDLKVGDSVNVMGKGTVVETSVNETTKGKERRTVEIQIEQMGCEGMAEEEDYEKEKDKTDILRYM